MAPLSLLRKLTRGAKDLAVNGCFCLKIKTEGDILEEPNIKREEGEPMARNGYEDRIGNLMCPECYAIWQFEIYYRSFFKDATWLECKQCHYIFEVPKDVLVGKGVVINSPNTNIIISY